METLTRHKISPESLSQLGAEGKQRFETMVTGILSEEELRVGWIPAAYLRAYQQAVAPYLARSSTGVPCVHVAWAK